MKHLATALTVLLVAASVGPVAATQSATGNAYAGTHVSFDVSNSAMTDYAVDGERVLSSVKVQSTESARSGGLIDIGASLSAITTLNGAGLSVGAKTEANATVTAEGSATMTAHDNGHGIMVVSAGGESQYVVANLSTDTRAEAESDSQVSVTTSDGTKGTFIVVGDGEVTVNDDGDVSAKLGANGRLVFRSYPEEKRESDQTQEALIADGKAAAEVYVMQESEGTITDTVRYGQNTTLSAKQSGEGAVNVTVDRAKNEGTVVITSVSDAVLNASDGVAVTVDGEAAVEASSYSELEGAIGSDQSKYMVAQQGSATASADVLVAVKHFSERRIRMSDSQDGGSDQGTTGSDDADGTTASNGDGETTGSNDDDDGTTNGNGQPGFGLLVSLVSLAGAALLARR